MRVKEKLINNDQLLDRKTKTKLENFMKTIIKNNREYLVEVETETGRNGTEYYYITLRLKLNPEIRYYQWAQVSSTDDIDAFIEENKNNFILAPIPEIQISDIPFYDIPLSPLQIEEALDLIGYRCHQKTKDRIEKALKNGLKWVALRHVSGFELFFTKEHIKYNEKYGEKYEMREIRKAILATY